MTVVIRNIYRRGKYRNARRKTHLERHSISLCLEMERKTFTSLQQPFETFFNIVNIQRNARTHF